MPSKFLPNAKRVRKDNHETKNSMNNFTSNLPILAHKTELLTKIRDGLTTVVIGETGSGKSTQLPQYILDLHKHGCIVCTQPRRVAAVTIAERVASEMNCELGKEVGFSIRFEDRSCEKTRIKYVTDGVLLREMVTDHNLKKYSVVILDEAHERSLQTDILMGLLRKLQDRRPDIRVVIMSATLEIDLFMSFFKVYSNNICTNIFFSYTYF
jgi:HrpA-like RNA helicase